MPTQAWEALTNADQYELLSIVPGHSESGIHGHEILGSVRITDPAVRRRLNYALQFGCRASIGAHFMCFDPRHAIRVTHDGVTTEILICFECNLVELWRGNQKIAFFTTVNFPQPVFDAALKNAGVTLAPKDE